MQTGSKFYGVPIDLVLEKNFSTDVYVCFNGKYVLYSRESKAFREKLARLKESGINCVYVREEAVLPLLNYLEKEIKNLLSKSPDPKVVSEILKKMTVCSGILLAFPTKESLEMTERTVKFVTCYVEENPVVAYMMGLVLGTDVTTAVHMVNVYALTVGFAYHLGFRGEDLIKIGGAAFLHDLGKAFVPERILKKTGKLTDKEYEYIKKHPTLGAQILEEHGFTAYIPVAEKHHEFIDGSGYPRGLTGKEIPFEVRLVQICDIYEALTGVRPYRSGLHPFEALTLLRDEFVLEGKIAKNIYTDFVLYLYRNKI